MAIWHITLSLAFVCTHLVTLNSSVCFPNRYGLWVCDVWVSSKAIKYKVQCKITLTWYQIWFRERAAGKSWFHVDKVSFQWPVDIAKSGIVWSIDEINRLKGYSHLIESVDYRLIAQVQRYICAWQWHVIQIMNVYECNGTNIFIRWKMKCSIQQGEAELNGTFDLSPNENICSIARMKKHSLFV